MARPHSIWSATWRLLLAALIGAVAFLGVWSAAITENPDLPPGPLLLDLALGVGALIAVGFRGRAPLAIGLVVCVAGGVSALAVGASLLVIVSLSARRRASWIAAAVGVTLASALAWQAVAGGLGLASPSDATEWLMLVLILPAVLVVPVLIGTNLGARRALIASLRTEAESAREEQQARADGARVAERTRIAQELHDELGHRLSLIALHAGALEYRDDVPADRARQTAGVIRASAEQALSDVRATLGMLRRPDADEEPSPDARERIVQSVTAATEAGMPLEARLDPEVQAALGSLPASTGRHLHRIVQECLTNARRHAPGQSVELEIGGVPGEVVRIRVRNEVPAGAATVRPGYGLVGVTERARLAGGDVRAGLDGAGGFLVEAWLPWTS